MTSTLASLILTILVSTAGTDTTVAVKPGTRLALDCFAGDIQVSAWSKDAVRIHAEHSRRTYVDIERGEGTLTISAHSRFGPPVGVDYRLTVPTWMPLELSGVAADISVEGVRGNVRASSVKGDVVVRGGGDFVSVESVEGDVKVSGARGRVEASSINQDIEVIDVGGEISVEAVNGDIVIGQVGSKSVEASTVNGSLYYDGPLKTSGVYSFSTHNGDIIVGLPPRPDVAVSVATFGGSFASYIAAKVNMAKRGKRFNFTLGSGSASLELESFQGNIRLERAGDAMKQHLERVRVIDTRPVMEKALEKIERARERMTPRAKPKPDQDPDEDPGRDDAPGHHEEGF